MKARPCWTGRSRGRPRHRPSAVRDGRGRRGFPAGSRRIHVDCAMGDIESGRTVVVLITSPPDKADEIASVIVEGKLAACVNIVPLVRSVFGWEGKVEHEDESLLLVKTTREVV